MTKESSKQCMACGALNNPNLMQCWKCSVSFSGASDPAELAQPAPAYLRFFEVSRPRFIAFYLGTFGLYEIYWFYRNWECIRNAYRLKIAPAARALFAIFFVHDLFKRILAIAKDKGYATKYTYDVLSTGWILGVLAEIFSDRIFNAPILRLGLSLVVLARLIVFLPVLDAIKTINAEQGFDGAIDRKITIGQILFVVAGLLGWAAFIFSGLVVFNVISFPQPAPIT